MRRRPAPPPPPGEERDPFYDDPRVRRLYDEAERILAEVSSPEKLKENPFRGRPLHLESNPCAGENQLAYRMLKSSGFKLPWMEMKEEILQEKAALEKAVHDHVAWMEKQLGAAEEARSSRSGLDPAAAAARALEEHQRFLEELAERVAQLRPKIARFNLEVPVLTQQLMNVRPEHFLQPVQERIDALLRLARSRT